MEELYRVIKNLDPGKEHELCTILAGENAGEKVLLTDGEVVWASPKCREKEVSVLLRQEVLRERLGHVTHLVVCGGGFVGQAVIRMAVLLGWHVTGIDDREEYARLAALAGAEETHHGTYSRILQKLSSDEETCYVIVTREHSFDRECLGVILNRPFGYLGVMGSHKRTEKLKQSLKQEGFAEDLIGRIHAPIGLPIGAQTPEEIAVSILAEIIQVQKRMPEKSAIPDEIMCAILKAFGPEEKRAAALAVISSREGSSPRMVGTRMLVFEDGSTVGTIGGGIMEADVIQTAKDALARNRSFRPFVHTVDLTGRSAKHADILCGGVTDVFLEPLNR